MDWVFGEREKPWRVMTVEEFSALPVRSGVIRAEFNYDGFGGVGVWLCGESDTPQDRTPPELNNNAGKQIAVYKLILEHQVERRKGGVSIPFLEIDEPK